jgi:uncharacterized protein HemY
MKQYNHSLDFTVLALASAADGDFATAGKLLVKASQAHDVKAAVAILEASNAQAFERMTASKKAPGAKVKAGNRVKAATRVRAFDIGDEDEIHELIEDDELPQGSDSEEVEAADEEDEDEEEGDFDKAFASMLKGMKGASKRK